MGTLGALLAAAAMLIAATAAQGQTRIDSLEVEDLRLPPGAELTIATGAVTRAASIHTIDTEGDAASDDLATISGGAAGDVLVIYPANGARTVVLDDAAGNILCAGSADITLDDADDWALLIYDGSNWLATGFTGGGSALGSGLTALEAFNTNGILAQTAEDTFAGRTITGTSNEITVTNGDGVSGNPTLSIPATIDLSGKTSFEVPNGASVTTDALGEIGADNDAWAASRGALQTYDGTAATWLVGVLTTDTPSNGQVPTWNTGGTITWETPASSLGTGLTALEAYNTNGLLAQTAEDTFAGRTITGTANEIDVTNGDGVSGNPTLDLADAIDLGGKTSLELPNSTSPTVNAHGEIALDTSITDMSHGLLKVYSGEETAVIAVPVSELTGMSNGQTIVYNSTADEFRIDTPSSPVPIGATAISTSTNLSYGSHQGMLLKVDSSGSAVDLTLQTVAAGSWATGSYLWIMVDDNGSNSTDLTPSGGVTLHYNGGTGTMSLAEGCYLIWMESTNVWRVLATSL